MTTPFLDIHTQVNQVEDRGLLGLAVDPNFATNGYVYLAYMYEGGGNPVTIGGGNFQSGATCSFGAITINSCAFGSSSQLNASIVVSATATVGGRTVTVTNPDAQNASLANSFTVNQEPPPPLPTLSSISPASGQQTQTLSVTLTGTNFLGGATCNFGAGITVNSCALNSSSQITANITIAANATTGTRSVTVTNPDGQSATMANAFTVNAAPPPPGIGAAYPFSEGTGITTADLSGNNNNGALQSGVTWTTGGKYGDALSFDGVNGYVSVPASSTLNLSSNGSIEAWVKLSAINRWNSVIAKGNVNADAFTNYGLEVTDGNRFLCILGSGSSARTLLSTSTVTAGTFYHVACVWNGTQLQLYINGALNTSVAQNLTPAANTSPLYIGQYGGNADRMSGVIDEVRIYGRALSQAEVQKDMNTPIAPPGPAPTVSGVNPTSGTQGQTLNTVITGMNFVSGASCSFGSGITVNSCAFNSATQLTANITIAAAAAVGARTVTVTNPDAQNASLANSFTVNQAPPPPPPTLNSISQPRDSRHRR